MPQAIATLPAAPRSCDDLDAAAGAARALRQDVAAARSQVAGPRLRAAARQFSGQGSLGASDFSPGEFHSEQTIAEFGAAQVGHAYTADSSLQYVSIII